MELVVGVSIVVIIITALVAVACYLTDQTAERHENKN